MSKKPTYVSGGSNIPPDVGKTAVKQPDDPAVAEPLPSGQPPILSNRAPYVEVGSAYEAASWSYATGTATPATVPVGDRQAAILALEPKLKELGDTILHTIVEGAEPAGPHLGNPDFPEELLKALARHEHGRRETERLKKEASKDRRRSLAEKAGLVVLTAGAGVLIGWLGL